MNYINKYRILYVQNDILDNGKKVSNAKGMVLHKQDKFLKI